jgi:hypothetical protein
MAHFGLDLQYAQRLNSDAAQLARASPMTFQPKLTTP